MEQWDWDRPLPDNKPPPGMGSPSSKIPMILMGVSGLVNALIAASQLPQAIASEDVRDIIGNISLLVAGCGFMCLAALSKKRRG